MEELTLQNAEKLVAENVELRARLDELEKKTAAQHHAVALPGRITIFYNHELDKFIANSRFADKDIFQNAEWRWDSDKKKWWTSDNKKASLLEAYMTPETNEILNKRLAKNAG